MRAGSGPTDIYAHTVFVSINASVRLSEYLHIQGCEGCSGHGVCQDHQCFCDGKRIAI